MEEYTIGEVARRAGIAPATLRYYEEVGVVPPARRQNGRRRYDASMVVRIRCIKAAQQAGFTLNEIREIFYGFPLGTPLAARWDAMAASKIVELDARLAQIAMMQRRLHDGLTCTCPTLEQCPVATSGTANQP